METEEKKKTHPSGHETHSGHICHKCGWTFPNSHPSARHRRAHKRVCGKIDGLQLIYFEEKAGDVSDDDDHASVNLNAEGDSENDSSAIKVAGAQKKSKEEVLYLNRLLFDTAEPTVGGLNGKVRSVGEVQGVNRIEKEVLPESVAEFTDAGSSRVAKEVVTVATQDPHHGLKNSTAAESLEILQLNDLTQGNEVQNPDVFESEPVKLYTDVLVQGHVLPPTDVIGPSTSDTKADSLTLEPGIETFPVEREKPARDDVGNTKTDTGEVIECSITEVVCNFDDEGDNKNAKAENFRTVYMLPIIPTSGSSEIDSKLHKMDDLTELGIQLNLPNSSVGRTVVVSSKDMVLDFKETDSTISDAPGEQTDTSGQQNLQNEAFPPMHLASMEPEGDNHQGGYVGTAKVLEGALLADSNLKVNIENQGDMVECCNGHGKLEINPPVLSTVEAVRQEALTSAISEEIRGREIHLENTVRQEANSGFMSAESIKTEESFPSSKQVQEDGNLVDGNGRTMQEELTVDQNGLDGNHIDGGSQFVMLDSGGCSVEGLRVDDQDLHPGTDDRESNENKGTTLVNIAAGSNELDAAHNHLDENKLDCSVGEGESHLDLSREILPETLAADVAGDSTSGLGAESIVCRETAMDVDGYDATHNESKDDHRDCSRGQERSIVRHSSPSTEISHEYMAVETGTSDPEANQQMDKSPLASTDVTRLRKSTDVTSKGVDGYIDDLENSLEPYSNPSNNLGEVSQEHSQQLTVGNCADPSVKKAEERVAQNDIDNRLSDNPDQELKSNQFSVVGSCRLDIQNPTSLERESSSSLSLENCNSRDSVQGNVSDSHCHSVQEGGNYSILCSSIGSALTMDSSVDSISQTDSIEGHWGSGSDGTVPSTRHATDSSVLLGSESGPNINIRTSMKSSNDILEKDAASKDAASKENHANSTELFEAPSFMTLVEPVKHTNRQHEVSEIHFTQKSQSPNSPSQAGWFPSLTNIVNESQGRKKNEETIAKVVNWSSGKTQTSLSRLLIEANLESKHKSVPAQEHTTLMTREGQVSQDRRPLGKTTKNSTVPTAKGVTKKESNSPARLPVTKNEKRRTWVPFMCCSSIN